MMETSRITPAVVDTLRLDAEFYGREYLRVERHLRSAPGGTQRLGELVADLRDGPGGWGVSTNDYVPEGIPVVRTVNIRDMSVDLSDCVFISENKHAELIAHEVVVGDVVLSVRGTIGRAAVYRSGVYPRASMNAAVVRMRPGPLLDSHFLVAFFNCYYGSKQSQRIGNGAVQQNMNLTETRSHWIAVPSPPVQRYIGDKVRHAEQLRDRAHRLEAHSNAFFKLAEWTGPRAGTRRSYTAGRVVMRSERLDAPFYDPGHEELDSLLRRRGGVELSDVASLVDSRWKRLGERFSYFEIGELDIASGILSPTTTEVAVAPSRAQILVEPWDVLVSTVRPNRKNVGLVLPSDDSLPLVASTGFAVLRFANAETAAFYHAFLRSDAATQQLMRWNSGATYPAIENDVTLRVRAPRFDDSIVEREGRRWLTKFRALQASRELTVVATALVEHLIDGRLHEDDLVAAQKALEAGDRSADREILKSLRQSDAPDAMPLIADVEALYALLDGSEGQDP